MGICCHVIYLCSTHVDTTMQPSEADCTAVCLQKGVCSIASAVKACYDHAVNASSQGTLLDWRTSQPL